MLPETEPVVRVKGSYESYQEKGGILPLEDCLLAKNYQVRDVQPMGENGCCSKQIQQIARHCEFEITPCEIAIYNTLRTQFPSQDELSRDSYPNSINTWQMSDQVLAREIFLLTDESGEKYRLITERYPHIFSNDIRY